jgi:ATP/maltotriose-dependent transcriptional regulator MalT
MLQVHLAEAVEIAERGLALVPASPARRAGLEQIDLLTTLGACRGTLGDHEGALRALQESARLAGERRDPVGACRAYYNLVYLSYDVADAARYARAGLAVARDYGLRSDERMFLLTLAWEETEQARFAIAKGLIEQGERIFSASAERLEVHTNLGRLALALGDIEEARAQFQDALRVLTAAGEPELTEQECSLAEACLALGDLEAARAALVPALERGRLEHSAEQLSRALLVAAQIAAISGDAREVGLVATELARTLPGHPRARLTEALAAAAAGAPEGAALILDATGAHAEAGWRADAPRWLLAAAEAVAHLGRPEAGDLARRALEDFRELGAEGWCRKAERLLRRLGRRVPSRASGAGRGGLTARELEVLRLLTEGASNRLIAERLFISEGTATRHVANIFTKLGVHSRAQAVRAAFEAGLLDEAVRE